MAPQERVVRQGTCGEEEWKQKARVKEERMGRKWLLCGQILEEHIGLKT